MNSILKYNPFFLTFRWAFFAGMFFFACSDAPSGNSVDLNRKVYFDLKGYFAQEISKLQNTPRFQKTAFVNGEKEEHTFDTLNLQRELAVFSDADINRSAWTDKYKIDSTFNDQQELVGLKYTATEDKLKTRLIEANFEQNKVVKIFIENSTSSAVAETRQLLTYLPTYGYTIESHQKVALTSDNSFKVEVRFLAE